MQDSHFKLFLPKERFFNIVILIRNEEINDLGILPFCSILAKLFPFSPRGFPGGSDGKESTRNVGNLGLIPGLRKSPGERKGYPLQYPGLESFMDCTVHGLAKSQTWLSNFHFLFSFHFFYVTGGNLFRTKYTLHFITPNIPSITGLRKSHKVWQVMDSITQLDFRNFTVQWMKPS